MRNNLILKIKTIINEKKRNFHVKKKKKEMMRTVKSFVLIN